MSDAVMAPGSAQLVNATIDALRAHAPFDRMEADALRFMAARLRVTYYPRGASIVGPDGGPVATMYIVNRGRVRGSGAETLAPTAVDVVLGPGECFPIGSLVGRRATVYRYRADADTFCYELKRADFEALLHKSAHFRDFCTGYLATLVDASHRALAAQANQAYSDQGRMLEPLRNAVRREPVTCTPETPLREALLSMHELGVGSIVVVDARRVPLGILTEKDVLARVALAERSLDTPIAEVMSPRVVTLGAEAPVFEAAVVMARHGIRHVILAEDGRVAGVISERDLFALQRLSLRQLAQQARAAGSVGELRTVAAELREFAQRLLAQGVGPEQLTHVVSALNDSVTERVIELAWRHHSPPGSFCWIALGSEGRLEQTLATDQDNALIFVADGPVDAARAKFLAFAAEVNDDLDACGFPLCKGGIMARNPRWCLPPAEWQRVFDDWIRNPDPQALLDASIFFDFRPLAGEARLAGDLREAVLAQAAKYPAFRRAMAEIALQVRPPLGLLRDFAPEDSKQFPGTLDLKKFGARPFVDAARVLALTHGIARTNTADRLRAAAETGALPKAEAAAHVEAFHFLQALRLRHQHLGGDSRPGAENLIDPEALNTLDRRILKEAFRQAAKLQERLRLDYQV